MTRFVSISITLFCALVLFGTIAFIGCGGPQGNVNTALTSPTPPVATVDCNSATHDDILRAIYKAIDKNCTYAKQEWQFNITEKTKTVTIIGWSADYVDIAKLVGDTATNCTIASNNFVAKPPDLGGNFRLIRSCANGYAPCGDVCIPVGEYCNITGVDAAQSPYACTGGPSPSPSSSSSPGPSPTKTP